MKYPNNIKKIAILITVICILLICIASLKTHVKEHITNSSGNNKVTIELKFEDGDNTEGTFVLKYWDYSLGFSASKFIDPIEIIGEPNEHGNIEFTVSPVYRFGYFSLGINERKRRYHNVNGFSPLFNHYLLEPGDSIMVTMVPTEAFNEAPSHYNNTGYYAGFQNFKGFRASFTGKGAVKYQCRYSIDSASYLVDDKIPILNDSQYNSQNSFEIAKRESLSILSKFKDRISPLAFQLINANIHGEYELDKYWIFQLRIASLMKNENGRQRIKKILQDGFSLPVEENLPFEYRAFSPFYLESVLKHYKFSLIDEGGYPSPEEIFEIVCQRHKGIERENLLALLIITYKNGFEDQQAAFNKVYTMTESEQLKSVLTTYSRKFLKGATVFPFELENLDGKMVKLKDFKGKVLLLDFWFTGCTGCSHFFKETLSNLEEEFAADENIEFISISVDKDRAIWEKSVESGKYTSNNAVNLFTNGMGPSHDLIKYHNVGPYPTIMIIDGDGKLYGVYNQRDLPIEKIKMIFDKLRR